MNRIDPSGLQPLSFADAYLHYIGGSGTPLTMGFDHLDIRPINLKEFPQIAAAMSDPCNKGKNISIKIDDRLAVGTKGEQKYFLGNITLGLKGELFVFETGNAVFWGNMSAYPDRFDFNPSTHRSATGEALTWFGNNFIPGTAYTINFRGSKYIGKRIKKN